MRLVSSSASLPSRRMRASSVSPSMASMTMYGMPSDVVAKSKICTTCGLRMREESLASRAKRSMSALSRASAADMNFTATLVSRPIVGQPDVAHAPHAQQAYELDVLGDPIAHLEQRVGAADATIA